MNKLTNSTNSRAKANIVPTDWEKMREFCSEKSLKYLEQSLKRLEKGTTPTPSFPLYGTRDHSKLFARIISTLEQMKLPKFLIEYEKTRLAKVGQQGGTPSWDKLRDNFQLYQTALKPVSYVDPDIMKDMCKSYAHLRCHLIGVKDTLAHLKRTDKVETRAAGWNQFELKKTDPTAQQEAVKLALNGDWIHGYGYTFARYNKLKYRIFMPMPFSSMVKQAQYFISFLEGIQKDILLRGRKSPYVAWADKVGFEKCFQILEDEINSYPDLENYNIFYFQNDFEKMDTRTGSEQYKAFFVPVMKAAHHTESADLVKSMMFTTTAPIVCPDGTMIGDHGTASGAEVTNGGESVCNDYYQRRLLWLLKQLHPDIICLARRLNGDDSTFVFAVPKSISEDDFNRSLLLCADKACKETGFDIQKQKLKVSSEYGLYCQYVYYYDRKSRKVIWFYPVVLAVNSIVHPEHEYTPAQWDKDYRDLDIIQKADNMSRHPAYIPVLDIILAGTKYPILGSSESETKRILAKYAKYRELQSLGERYNRTDYNIANSPTVNYILSKR